MEFVFELYSKPGVPNKNGVVFSQETFDKLINSNDTKNMIANKDLFVTYREDNKPVPNFIVDFDNVIGYVKDWDGPKVTAEVQDRFVSIVEEIKDDVKLGMNYTCRLNRTQNGIEAIAMKIYSFSIYNKESILGNE